MWMVLLAVLLVAAGAILFGLNRTFWNRSGPGEAASYGPTGTIPPADHEFDKPDREGDLL